MDVLASGGVTIDDEPAEWVAALADWIGQDVHPRFIITSDLECLWKNDAARKMLGENGANAGASMSKTLTFFDPARLRSLLQDAEDDLVHWGVVPDWNGVNLIVWAKAIGAAQNRLFGLVLMPPDHEPSFRELFENARLTPAEARIIDAILRGESLANTASVSGVSRETIKTQLKNAYRKLSVSSRGELFAEARRFLAP
jgi:DNA-binding CsgD family transcriptional regulator